MNHDIILSYNCNYYYNYFLFWFVFNYAQTSEFCLLHMHRRADHHVHYGNYYHAPSISIVSLVHDRTKCIKKRCAKVI